MTIRPTRRSFFGGLSAILFGAFVVKKLPPALPVPPKPQPLPTMPLESYSVGYLSGPTTNVTTVTYNSNGTWVSIVQEQGKTATWIYDGINGTGRILGEGNQGENHS